MAALVPIKVGGYSDEDPILHTEMNLINDQIVKAPNFVEGGASYAPAATVSIGGLGLTFTSVSACWWASGGRASFLSGSSLIQNTGSSWDLFGDLEFKSASTTTFEAGSGLSIATTMEFEDGSAINSTGEVTINLIDVTTINENGTVYFGPTALVTALSGASIAFNTGSTFINGASTTFSGYQAPSGSTAQRGNRINSPALTAGTYTLGAEKDIYEIAHTQGGVVTVKLRTSSPAPLVDGHTIEFIREDSDGLNAVEFQKQDATPIITLLAGAGFARIQFYWSVAAGRWKLRDVNPVTAFDFTP